MQIQVPPTELKNFFLSLLHTIASHGYFITCNTTVQLTNACSASCWTADIISPKLKSPLTVKGQKLMFPAMGLQKLQ